VILDANVLISYLLASDLGTGPVATVVEAGLVGRYQLLLPRNLLDEFLENVVAKPYLAARIGPAEARSLAAALRRVALPLPALRERPPRVVRDPDDDYLLAAARLGAADILVTGDKDLLALDPAVTAPLRVVSPADFGRELGER
jgi:putative PIN family toxin of toxin-antitoxin system